MILFILKRSKNNFWVFGKNEIIHSTAIYLILKIGTLHQILEKSSGYLDVSPIERISN